MTMAAMARWGTDRAAWIDCVPAYHARPRDIRMALAPWRASRSNGGTNMPADFFIGESLVGDGNEVAHIDLIIGSKSGPAGLAFTHALTNQKEGFNALLAVVTPNLPAKPDTILFNKVTIKGAKQAVQMFGPAQAAVARAVVDSVEAGVIPRDRANDLCVLAGVFIHWDATDDQKIFDNNYRATRESIERALGSVPTVDTVIAQEKTAEHPYAHGAEHTAGAKG
jgi:5,6,7,8-tetrahydromethanopterin hydro-lyase